MKMFAKLKLLFAIRKPLSDLAENVKTVKSGWKTLAFWVTLLGSLGSTAAALNGVIPPQVQLIVTTALTTLYNVLRGLQKAEEPEVKGTFRTSELYLSALGEVQKGLVAIQAGGINPEWVSASAIVVAAALGAGQNLAARDVKKEAPVTPPQNG